MQAYAEAELHHMLAETGVREGDVVFIQSALFALGRIRGHPIAAIPEIITAVLRDHVGAEGTLAVPTFNFGFCRGELFDRQATPAENMGVLAEYIRQLPGSRRSPHAIQSIAALGARADWLCSRDTPSAFSEEGPFGMMKRCNALFLQLESRANSFMHVLEEAAEVPYRFWKSFTGLYLDAGHRQEKTYWMYARDLNVAPRPYFDEIEARLKQDGQFVEQQLGGGAVRAFRVQDFCKVGMELLQEDLFSLVVDRERIRSLYA